MSTKKEKIVFKKPISLLNVPDMQISPNIDLRFVYAIGCYLRDKRPDVFTNIGDMADMPSLSSYDKGKKGYEGRRYANDIESVITAQDILFDPINQANAKIRRKGEEEYKPLKLFLIGNHEDRIDRACDSDPMLDGTLDLKKDLKLDKYWDKTYDFLQQVNVQGTVFSHYFTTGSMGRPCATAQSQLNVTKMSSVSGHQPGRQTANSKSGDGTLITSIIAGSSYPHDLKFMGKQGNQHWRGVIMLHNVIDGKFDEVYVPTEYLLEKYTTGMAPVVFSPKRRKSEGV